MDTSRDIKSEIKLWLEKVLEAENLNDLSVKIVGNSEKGDGYMGDIVFVTVTGKIQDGSIKKYDLVLKCSKRSRILRESSPVKEAFMNEIFFYEKILPSFTQFQKDKGIDKPFDSVPKCYGSLVGEDMEIIVFENLKKRGYELWPKKQPLTKKHIEMVAREYGKFHATSIGFQRQYPTKFQEFVEALDDTFKKFIDTNDPITFFGSSIDESYELVKDDLDSNVLLKWKKLKEKIIFVLKDMITEQSGLKVLLHGDCWNNNFMYLCENTNQEIPAKVAILDWQIARYSSPILDLSYFLFACTSENDLENLNDILAIYYKSFVDQLKRLGTNNAEMVYPFQQFLTDWKTYSKFGVLMVSLILKICSTEKDEVIDIAQAAENGIDMSHAFMNEIRDKDNFKNRIKPIIQYVVSNDLI